MMSMHVLCMGCCVANFLHSCFMYVSFYGSIIIIHWAFWFVWYVCSVIKSASCRESARDTSCLFRDRVGMFLGGCRSTSCLVVKEHDSFVHSPWADTPFLGRRRRPYIVFRFRSSYGFMFVYIYIYKEVVEQNGCSRIPPASNGAWTPNFPRLRTPHPVSI